MLINLKSFVFQESKYGVNARNVSFVIKKKESGPYWPHLLKGVRKVRVLD